MRTDPPSLGTPLSGPQASTSGPGNTTVGTVTEDEVLQKFNEFLKSQVIDKEYRAQHWNPPDWKPCPRTTSAVKALVESHGFSPDDWVADVRRDKKGMAVWRFHWGSPTSYLDTKVRLSRCIVRMVQEGRMLTKDELREIYTANRQPKAKKLPAAKRTPGPSGGAKRPRVGSEAEASRRAEALPLYDSDGDIQDGAQIATRKVGSQMMRYHVDRGPRPDREQLQVMRSEFVNKKVLLTATISRIGMSEGRLCADLKLGKSHLRAQRWLGLEGCMQTLDAAEPAVAVLAEQQDVVQKLRQNLKEAEDARDTALDAQEVANQAVGRLEASLHEARAAAKAENGNQESEEVQEMRSEIARLKAIEQKYEQFVAVLKN